MLRKRRSLPGRPFFLTGLLYWPHNKRNNICFRSRESEVRYEEGVN